ncbi:MAG: cold shock and DUF1294 domain-containing protein [Gammaproteobacteria bacterium]|nr:cold shock and DUF1294 domain-containing protein [Gammaproteobacteria bacterium]
MKRARAARSQGRVVIWKDDRGFGFIAPEPSGERLFVHVRSFASRSRRPVVGERVTFATRLDDQRRPQAIEVRWVGGASSLRRASVSQIAATLLALGFLGLMAVLYGLGRIQLEVLGLYAFASAVSFFVYALDKAAARAGRWRTQESTLQFVTALTFRRSTAIRVYGLLLVCPAACPSAAGCSANVPWSCSAVMLLSSPSSS